MTGAATPPHKHTTQRLIHSIHAQPNNRYNKHLLMAPPGGTVATSNGIGAGRWEEGREGGEGGRGPDQARMRVLCATAPLLVIYKISHSPRTLTH